MSRRAELREARTPVAKSLDTSSLCSNQKRNTTNDLNGSTENMKLRSMSGPGRAIDPKSELYLSKNRTMVQSIREKHPEVGFDYLQHHHSQKSFPRPGQPEGSAPRKEEENAQEPAFGSQDNTPGSQKKVGLLTYNIYKLNQTNKGNYTQNYAALAQKATEISTRLSNRRVGSSCNSSL
jgi:hypothetical protein